LAKAKQLWHENRAKKGDPSYDINPELEELRESGFISLAQSELMRDKHRAEIESQYVDFPHHFTVDLSKLYEANGLILGSRHTGKSDVAMLICDKAVKENAVVVCFDPSLDWIQRSSIAHYMKVEPYTLLDVPSENIIFDISLLSPIQQQKSVETFSKRLFENQAESSDRKQYLVIFEEAHTYFPQGCMRAKSLQNTVRLLSVGRNVDIACILISQFAAMLDKFAIKHSTSQAWFGYTREPNDIKYLRQILGEETKELTKLEDGKFLYLKRNGITKIQIEPYESSVAKTEVKPSVPQIQEQIKPKPQHHDNGKVIGSILVALIWLIAIAIAVKPT